MIRLRLASGFLATLVLLASAAAWALVSTDRWPLPTKGQPASSIYSLNGSLGRWLALHGDAPPEVRPVREQLTAEERAQVERMLKTDPSLKDRFFFDEKAKRLQPPPLAAGHLNLSTASGGSRGGGGGGRRG